MPSTQLAAAGSAGTNISALCEQPELTPALALPCFSLLLWLKQ